MACLSIQIELLQITACSDVESKRVGRVKQGSEWHVTRYFWKADRLWIWIWNVLNQNHLYIDDWVWPQDTYRGYDLNVRNHGSPDGPLRDVTAVEISISPVGGTRTIDLAISNSVRSGSGKQQVQHLLFQFGIDCCLLAGIKEKLQQDNGSWFSNRPLARIVQLF